MPYNKEIPEEKSYKVIPLEKLMPHPSNFFRQLDLEEIKELAASIKENGLIEPMVVRPVEGGYEIISGHNRKEALEYLGIKEVEAKVVNVDDITAELMLIDANLKFRPLSPMEIARAIRRKKELMGERRGNKGGNNCPLSGKTREIIAQQLDMSPRQVENYDKLNDLIPDLQLLVDTGKLTPTAASQLALLEPEVQQELYDALGDEITTLKVKEVKRLKEESERGYLILNVLQKHLEEVENELKEYEKENASGEKLKAEIAKLRQEKKQLEYDIIDRQNALQNLESRAARKGAALINLLERVCKPVLAAKTEMEYYLNQGIDDEAMRVYALNWAAALKEVAGIIEMHLQPRLKVIK
ncbi:ParB N-terminal domain-containing protein [Moorella naiadis]|uniref:ParB/RepB/Spo0J family partition protein n=1 Tax=Moorella naiadis (nom. illeg.) TaxID=3093670 RepID=UPI003D9C9044